MEDENKKYAAGIFFEGIGKLKRYPAWRYHSVLEPLIVYNEAEDKDAYDKGWREPFTPITSNQGFSNFYHDLEDMTIRQLCKYAKDEYGAELPVEASKAKLLRAIWTLASSHPKNKGRMVLLAQSIEMNYDETLKAIENAAGDIGKCDEIESEIIWV